MADDEKAAGSTGSHERDSSLADGVRSLVETGEPAFQGLLLDHRHWGQGGYGDPVPCETVGCDGLAMVDTSLGSLMRAAGECGWKVHLSLKDVGRWRCGLGEEGEEGITLYEAPTPELALARAILAAYEAVRASAQPQAIPIKTYLEAVDPGRPVQDTIGFLADAQTTWTPAPWLVPEDEAAGPLLAVKPQRFYYKSVRLPSDDDQAADAG
jgi:hypothetical protein